jgi:hypothetical protein
VKNGSFTAVLGELDPVSRALLDLSLRRGLRPEEIADVLGTGEDSVVEARERALVSVADELGMEGEDRLDQVRALLAELPPDEWSGVAPPIAIDEDVVDAEPGEEIDAMATAGPDPALLEEAEHELEAESGAEVVVQVDKLVLPPEFIPRDELAGLDSEDPAGATQAAPDAPEYVAREELPAADEEPPIVAEPERSRAETPATPADQARKQRRSRTPILLALLTLAIAVGVLLAVLAGGDDDSNPAPSASTPAPAPSGQDKQAEPAAAAARFTPVGVSAREARGTAQLTGGGDRLKVSVRGLAAPSNGAYTVWLYNSVIDARSLGSARSGTISLDAKLPEKISRYRDVDISFEPADHNANHSGRSLLRVPVAKLLKK